jgi:hypothetical protein
MLADYRRPGRPKGSRDRVPRKNAAKRTESIRHTVGSSMEMKGSTGLDLCCDGKIHIIEEMVTAENHAAYQDCTICITPQTILQNDPFYADWTYW